MIFNLVIFNYKNNNKMLTGHRDTDRQVLIKMSDKDLLK